MPFKSGICHTTKWTKTNALQSLTSQNTKGGHICKDNANQVSFLRKELFHVLVFSFKEMHVQKKRFAPLEMLMIEPILPSPRRGFLNRLKNKHVWAFHTMNEDSYLCAVPIALEYSQLSECGLSAVFCIFPYDRIKKHSSAGLQMSTHDQAGEFPDYV